MSDSIIAILGMGFLIGAMVTLTIIGAVYGSDKEQSDRDHRRDIHGDVHARMDRSDSVHDRGKKR